MVVRPGSKAVKVALRILSGSDKVVKVSGKPAVTLVTSPSAICILLSMVLKLAICTILGALCTAFTVWPSSTGVDTTVPSMGATMRV